MSRNVYLWDPACLEHDTGTHPECIARARALSPDNMIETVPHLDAPPIEPHDAVQWICELHARDYHDEIKALCGGIAGRVPMQDGDTILSPGSYGAALAAVNAVLTAADAIVTGEADNAFCAIRPPGHHALANRQMGFCLFGNVSILARYLQKHHGVGRVAIVDWDVHHGNGTQDFFYEDSSVLFISLQQFPFWPGSGSEAERGRGAGEGFTLNIPFPSHTHEPAYFAKFESIVLPALNKFKPEFMIVSAGFDAHRDDPLGELELTEAGYARMTRWLKDVADQHCAGRIVSCLEGGYNLEALQASVAAHVNALTE
ncbi:MAG TPA: histone deacetylase [Phycisphaerae bacterium]|nr:histone deacetylase [Phycisphaerae bacterium]